MTYAALTIYGVPIVGGQKHSRQAALEWARQQGDYYPGSKIVQLTSKGKHTIWKHKDMQS